MSISVLLVDDHDVVRRGLVSLLRTLTGLEVVGEAADGRTAVRMARDLCPDVVILDVGLPELNGMSAARAMLRDDPAIKILALSIHTEREFVDQMLAAGASGYLLKNAVLEELHPAIQTVCRGGTYLSPGVAAAGGTAPAGRTPAPDRAAAALTLREREIVQLVAEGFSSKEIAGRLHISVRTVDAHRRAIMSKLGLHNVAELTRFAIREGLTFI